VTTSSRASGSVKVTLHKWTQSYGRNDEWSYSTPSLEIVVHRHMDHPGEWRWSCYRLNLLNRPGDDWANPTVKQAQTVALKAIKKYLGDLLAEIKTAARKERA
jgi:hypothetical protein